MTPQELRELRELEIDILRRREMQASSCAGKFAFDSQVDARKAIRHGRDLEPYRCSQCGSWHLGSSDERRKRTKVRRNIYRIRRSKCG